MRLFALFGLAFASASRERLTLPHTANSPAHSSKGTPSPRHGCPWSRLRQLVGSRFQVLFHSPSGVLFTFPTRYWFTIGRQVVFSLRGWSPQIHTGFQGSRATREHHEGGQLPFVYRVVTFCDGPFHGLRLGTDFVTPRILRNGSMWVPRPRPGNAFGL